ncbi:MAG: RrF2 family transcriptional regulator [Syntrophomonadaceae bacterium]|jgi:Rrf2 family protein
MQITRQTEYAIRILLELATLPPGQVISSKVIAQRQDIPEDFLKKIVQQLVISGMVSTQRGTQGGVRLVADIEQVTIADVMAAIEGPLGINPCLLPGYSCENMPQCPIRPVLARAQAAFLNELRKETLADLLKKKVTG